MQDPRKRTFPEDSYPPRSAPFRGSSPAGNAYAPYASSDAGRAPPKRGRGKGPTSTIDAGFTPTTEHRIPVDISSFPLDSNIIMQLLGPRGRHQQRMKNDSDTIVTTTGKGSRGPLAPGEEPLSLVIRSKDPSIPLTQRQIAVVHQIYEDILHHVRERVSEFIVESEVFNKFQRKPANQWGAFACLVHVLVATFYKIHRFGNSDNAATGPLSTNQIPPMSLLEFLWNLHLLLSRPRPIDLQVDELFDSYRDMFGHDCPIASWLVVDPASGGIQAALGRIPHILELYQSGGVCYMRPANPPDTHFAQLREVDDAYKIRLQQIAAGQIPLEDLADTSGVITGLLFGVDKVNACVNILQAVIKVVSEKGRSGPVAMDLSAIQSEFQELFKIPLDVYQLINEKSLLMFLVKFKTLFSIYNDGVSWKLVLAETWAEMDIENLVKTTILVQPRARRVIKLCGLIPLPQAAVEEPQEEDLTEAKQDKTDSVTALMSLLQGFQKPAEPAATQPSTVTAQIQQLLQKKKQQPAQPAGSGAALNELMAALQAAKNK